MTDRWQQVEKICQSALELEESQRAAFLDQACAGDRELRREVESLLQFDSRGDRFIEEPAVEVAAKMMTQEKPESLVGRQLGAYRIDALLGTGGMGVVYKARDPRLNRTVAIKVLPRDQMSDPERKRRFIQEARAASALNHPNIITVYDIGSESGTDFIVMEYVAGKTLDQRIPRTGMPLNETLKLAIQMADALAKAHSAGIIHRDLKPGNMMVTDEGLVKVLDFGLAKLSEVSERGDEITLTLQPKTEEGRIVGTVCYMSPEQIRGKVLDTRTDLFSFGIVLYEMATGQKPFSGTTPGVIQEAILNRILVFPLQQHRELTPKLGDIIGKALEKERDLRYQSASELSADLKRLQRDLDSVDAKVVPPMETSKDTRVPSHAFLQRWLLVLLVGTAVFLVLFGTWRITSHRLQPPAVLKETQLTTNSSETSVTTAAISFDGKYLAYADETGVYLKFVETAELHPLSVPRGSRIGFLRWFKDGAKLLASGYSPPCLWSIPVMGGGTPRKLRDDAWEGIPSPDGSLIAFQRTDQNEVWVMGPDGEEARRIAGPEQEVIRPISWLPDGQRLLVLRTRHDSIKGAVENLRLECQDLKTSRTTLILSDSNMIPGGTCLPDGRFLFPRQVAPARRPCSLWELKIDLKTGRVTNRPRQITPWQDPIYSDMTVSADGKRMALLKVSSQADVYVGKLEENGLRLANPYRVTLDDKNDFPTGWTPDSKAVLFTSDRNGNFDIFRQALGERVPEVIVATPKDECDGIATPDGAWVLYFTAHTTARQISTEPVPLVRAPISGGPSQVLLNEKGIVNVHCARPGINLCVVDEQLKNQLVLYALDPAKGKGRELTRIDIDSLTEEHSWGLSPDGTRIAVLLKGENHNLIRTLTISGGPSNDIATRGWRLQAIYWTAEGKGWIANGCSPNVCGLIHVDLQGRANILQEDCPWAVPSPDGRYLAFPKYLRTTTVAMLENF